MQSCPAAQSLFCLHAGFASAALAQTPCGEHTLMRASICAHWRLVLHVYRQNPPMHCCGDAPLQSLVALQFGVGRVSTSHAPWLQ
jgi:hypothetical protein